MKLLIKIFSFLFITLSPLFSAVSGQNQGEDIQSAIDRFISSTPGVGIAVGYIDGGKTSFYFSGKRSIDDPSPISKEDIFEIGSITKVFTTLALAELAMEEKLALSDPIDKYITEVKIPSKNGKKINFYHLATHSSGLPYMPSNFAPKNVNNPYLNYDRKLFFEFLNTYELGRVPGEKFEYSNLAMALLGYTLSSIDKKSYDRLIKERILLPLKMNNTYVFVKDAPKEKVVPGHHKKHKVSNWDFTVFAPAGSICSNIEDMTLFLAANMGVNSTELYKFMKKAHEPVVEVSADIKDKIFGAKALGLGWVINPSKEGQIIWHNGGTGGYKSFLGFNPTLKKGIVILSNSTEDVTKLGLHILDPSLY